MPHDTVLCGPSCASSKIHVKQAALADQFTDFFSNIFDTSNWPPRWYCGTWSDFHGWLYIASDLGIWAAYFAIPLLLVRLLVKRKDIPFLKIFALFIAFILLCGLTHFFDALIFWWPAYRFSALLRFVTAAVSISTVYALYKVTPLILSLRSPRELEAEIEKRRVIEEKLAASEFLLSEAGRISKVGGWEIDLLNNKRSWSKTIYEIYNLPYDFPLDGYDTLSKFVAPYRQKIETALANAKKFGIRWDLELLMSHEDGTSTWVRSIGEPFYDDDGRMTKLRGVFMDIDRYKLNEIALNRSLDQITQNNHQLKNFTHILSHNIRNHASNISLISSLINHDTLDEDNSDIVNKIKNISDGLNNTLTDLAEAIKIKDSVIQAEVIALHEVTDKVLDILQSDIQTTGAEISRNYQVSTVKFPPIYLESIILNLVNNAIKYRKPDAKPVIQLSSYRNGQGQTIWECRDNGMGIDLTLHGEKLFGLYKTFHAGKDARGVGLFLVKTQVESQGGRILVESTPGLGSTFKIIFNEED